MAAADPRSGETRLRGAAHPSTLGGASGYRMALSGLPVPPGVDTPMRMRFASPGYFAAIGIAIEDGRTFSDSASSPSEVLLNREFVRRYFGGRSPLGSVVAQGASQYTIVGIIGDVRHDGPRSVVEPEYTWTCGSAASPR